MKFRKWKTRRKWGILLAFLIEVAIVGCHSDRSPRQSSVPPDNPRNLSPASSAESNHSATGATTEPTEPNHLADPSQPPTPWEETTGDWPLARGNPSSTGVAMSRLPETLEVLWTFQVEEGSFEGSAVIVAETDDPTQRTVYIGELGHRLFALDLHNGKKRWEMNTEAGFRATPAVQAGMIFVGDRDGRFYGIDERGKERWVRATDAEINSSANVHGRDVFVASQDATVRALDRQTGKRRWLHEAPDQIQCGLTVAQDHLFIAGCDGYFHSIDIESGNEVGRVDIGGPTRSTPAIVGDLAFFGTEEGSLFGVNWKQSTVIWEHHEAFGRAAIGGGAAVTADRVIFGARNKKVYSLDPKTGDLQWKSRLKGPIVSSPVIVGDRVFVSCVDGRLVALAIDSGEIVWEKEFNGSFLASPAVAFERLVIATDRGVVYCLGRAEKKRKE